MKIAVINDLSGMGRCSLTASIPILNALGQQVFPVPTAILSNQTGYDKFSFFDFTDHMDEYIENWKILGVKFDCIYSGFLSNVKQAEKILYLKQNCGTKDTLLLVDPVMGDGGKMYATFDKALCDKVKALAKSADVVTPNFTEACLITDTNYAEFCKSLNEQNFYDCFYALAQKVAGVTDSQVVITGIECNEGLHYVYNFVLSKEGKYFTKNRMYGGHYSGTGDIMASIIAGELCNGKKLHECVRIASDFLEVAVKDAFHHSVNKNDGVNFEKFLPDLILSQAKR